MDRKLKERLIGLVVLLTAAVIIVPMILGERESVPDDPAQRPVTDRDTREVRLDLAESETGEAREEPSEDPGTGERSVETDVPDEPGEQDISDRGFQQDIAQAREELAREAEEGMAQEPEEPAEEEEAAPEQDRAEDPGTARDDESDPEEPADGEGDADRLLEDGPEGSGWSAQVGSFSQRDNAETLVREIREQGLEAFLMRHEADGRVLYRVRVGLEDDRDGAVGLAREIENRTGHAASPVPHP